jgi:heme O synthase-like polyprenyltransferase
MARREILKSLRLNIRHYLQIMKIGAGVLTEILTIGAMVTNQEKQFFILIFTCLQISIIHPNARAIQPAMLQNCFMEIHPFVGVLDSVAPN